MILALGLALVSAPVKDRSDTSMLEAWFVVMSSRSRVVQSFTQPSLWTRDWQVVSERNALMTSASTTSGRELHYFENLQMKSHRDSLGSCWQLLRSQEFPERTYIP